VTLRMLPASALLLVAAAAATIPGTAVEVPKLRHAVTLYADEKGTPLRVPQGVGCGAAGTLLVADSGNGRVLRVEVTGSLATVTAVVSVAEIAYPIRVDGDAAGGLVVLDGKSRRLARLRPDGSFGGWIEVPAAEGAPPPAIRSFALEPDGAVLAADVAGPRVVEISAAGALQRAIDLPHDARGLTDVAVDGRGSIFALDGVGRRIWVARPGDTVFGPFSGSLAPDVEFPGALATDPSGLLLVADEDGGSIVMLGPDGSFRGRQSAFGWKDGLLRYPTDLCSNGHGLVAVADRENQRVQVFELGE
jgi:sugar lactone lactonase YvrE